MEKGIGLPVSNAKAASLEASSSPSATETTPETIKATTSKPNPVSSPISSMDFYYQVNKASWGRADFDAIIGDLDLVDSNKNDEKSPSAACRTNPNRHDVLQCNPASKRPTRQQQQQQQNPSRTRSSPCVSPGVLQSSNHNSGSRKDTISTVVQEDWTTATAPAVTTTPKSTKRSLFHGRSPRALARLRAAFTHQNSNGNNTDESSSASVGGSESPRNNALTPKVGNNNRRGNSLVLRSPAPFAIVRHFKSYNEKTSSSPNNNINTTKNSVAAAATAASKEPPELQSHFAKMQQQDKQQPLSSSAQEEEEQQQHRRRPTTTPSSFAIRKEISVPPLIF